MTAGFIGMKLRVQHQVGEWRANTQRYRKRKKENIDTIKSNTEDQSTPEEYKRSLWRANTEHYRKRQNGTLANEGAVQCDSACGMKRKANVAQLPKNVEFQNQYRRRNSTQIISQAGPSGKINPSLCTGEQSRANDGVYDSGIWVPDAAETMGLDEENLETHKSIDDDIDDPFADDEARVFFRPDVRYKSYRANGQDGGAKGRSDPYDYVYDNLPKKHHVLGHAPDCEHCGAKRFPGEGAAFCCREGMVRIHIPEVPAELRRLYTSQSDRDAKWFRNNIRYFNSHFSFTSMGVKLDRRYATAAGTGIYTFRKDLKKRYEGCVACVNIINNITSYE
ncbi:hypothetical protein EJB05_21745, partial [Eragrostis curvula]